MERTKKGCVTDVINSDVCAHDDFESCVANGFDKLRHDLIRLYYEKDADHVKLGNISINQLIGMLQKKQNTLKASLYRMATGGEIENPDDYTVNELVDRVDGGIIKTTSELYALRESVTPDMTKRPIREYIGTEDMPNKIGEIKGVLSVEKGRVDEITEKKVYITSGLVEQPEELKIEPIVKPEFNMPLSTYVGNLETAVNDAYNTGRRGRCIGQKFPKLSEGENASIRNLHEMLKIYKKCESCHCKYIGECNNEKKHNSKSESKHGSKHEDKPVICKRRCKDRRH